MYDRYGADVLTAGSAVVTSADRTRRASAQRHRAALPKRSVAAERGLVVEQDDTGWVGAVIRVQKIGGMHVVDLEDRRRKVRTFPLDDDFSIDGEPVRLTAPIAAAPAKPTRTASGSRAVGPIKARVARDSRIWVEGKHDAQLIEQVWGDDLRVEGVVVEELDGVDNLADALADFGPTPQRRVGVLVDHLLPGTKEQRLAEAALRTAPRGTVLVLGHPYVDVWQAVRPERIGIEAWPVIERGTEWKVGICDGLGWPSQTQADLANAWRRILKSVRDYRDLEPSLLGRVEELIDFVTVE